MALRGLRLRLRRGLRRLRAWLAGPALTAALERNARAACELDHVVREVLHR